MRTIRTIIAGALAAALVASLAAPSLAGAVTAPDDDIPGVALPASPFSGSLADVPVESLDLDDIYAVPLNFNERIDVTMTLDPQVDFDLYLLSPSTKNLKAFLDGAIQPAISSVTETNGAMEKFTYVSDRSTPATWFLDVSWWNGAGNYTINYTKTQLPTPSITATAPAVAPYGGAVLVTGTASVDGMAMTGFTTVLQAKAAGTTSWRTMAQSTTATEGAFAFTARPVKQTQYRVMTKWSGTKSGTAVGWGFSNAVTITPKAYVAFRSTPSSARAGKVFSVTGYLKPSHAASSRHVKVIAYQKVSGRWVPKKSAYARSIGTAFSASLALPKGSWKLVASVPADTLHAPTSSSARYLSVR